MELDSMYTIYNANPLTIWLVMAMVLAAPLYFLWIVVQSPGASPTMGLKVAALWVALGCVQMVLCLAGLRKTFGDPGYGLVPLSWTVPAVLLWRYQDVILQHPLNSQLVSGWQVCRAGGGVVFLLEYVRGHLPLVFVVPAAGGDFLVALLASWLLWNKEWAKGHEATNALVYVGLTQFAVGFCFGVTSAVGPMQVFYPDPPSRLSDFPTGLVILYLVPYCIFLHVLAYLNQVKYGNSARGTTNDRKETKRA